MPKTSTDPGRGRLGALLLGAVLALGGPAQADEPEAAPAVGVHGLKLPASFAGRLPCADCDGIETHLDLWPDQVYHLSRRWLGRAGEAGQDAIGRWYADPALDAIVLTDRGGTDSAWQVKGPDRLRLLDRDGRPIESDLPYDLTGDGSLAPAELSLPLAGLFTYYADAALFQECISGRRYPVADEADYLALETAYVAARPEPGTPLLATLDATIGERETMEGLLRPSVVVERTIAVWPGETCAHQLAQPPLADTYWRISSLKGQALSPDPERRPPYLVLLSGAEPRFAATVGCNTRIGGYRLEGERLSFGQAASTLMACPEPLDSWERRMAEVLAATAAIRRGGFSLVLLGADGKSLAVLEAADPR